jgi:hypothetical protein
VAVAVGRADKGVWRISLGVAIAGLTALIYEMWWDKGLLGMAGQATESYVVFDPTDRLRYATHVGNGRRAMELPCDVWQIWRLEPQWYSVVFYTNTLWLDANEREANGSPC